MKSNKNLLDSIEVNGESNISTALLHTSRM